jgi:multidrug efflux pump subunit AcrA (membrane-fusion protein)
VAGGNPVVTLAGAGVEVVVEAPEPVWARLSTAEAPIRATVALPGLGCTAPAMPTAVARAAGGPGALFPVHLDVPSTSDCPVVPGLTAAADLALPRPPGLAVPVRAVVAPTGDDPAVFRVREGRAERVSIAPGELLGDTVAVDGGLEAGDEVVVAGLVGLVDAAAVEVVR